MPVRKMTAKEMLGHSAVISFATPLAKRLARKQAELKGESANPRVTDHD
jgi:hypothetical protein